ncbi:MAG TPA: carboxypeptidase-like regulatory domain-containing protein, partial [Gemmatimonadaceae bacterium]|nr:carboxypeptidase-like regulatory domain-containing protein [Gemmatimonadaceae bacterium]
MALLALLLDGRSAVAQATYTVFPAAAPVATTTAPQPIGHDVRVTLVVEDSTVAYAIQALTQQAKLHVLYHSGDPVFSKRIAVHLVNTPIMDALAAVLQGTGLRPMLSFDGETVLIRPQDGAAHAQGGLVAGRVTDSASQAGFGGVSVKIEGTKLRTVTSDSGHFTLRDVPPGEQVLSVRLFGYKPAERTVTIVDSERTTVQIAMVPVPTVLSGVVTTATGLQRKVEVGNDITTLNVDSIMRVAPITSVTDLLETRVPGLTVLHTSGVPGDPSRIRIRGASSITGNNDPIVIVDGIRVYANQSDPRNDNLAPSLIGGVGNQGSNQIITKPTYAAPSPLDQIDPN